MTEIFAKISNNFQSLSIFNKTHHHNEMNYRYNTWNKSNHQRCSIKKAVLKIFAICTGKLKEICKGIDGGQPWFVTRFAVCSCLYLTYIYFKVLNQLFQLLSRDHSLNSVQNFKKPVPNADCITRLNIVSFKISICAILSKKLFHYFYKF